MIEALRRVLEKLILTKFPEVATFRVHKMGLGETYVVTYYFESGIDNKRAYDLFQETDTLFKMVSPHKDSDVLIDFKEV